MAISKSSLENLHPAYFALVMATGIVSIACHLLDFKIISQILFLLNIFFFLVLCVCVTLRIFWYQQNFLKDLTDHNRGVGFFSLVAAMCVLGSQFVILLNNQMIGRLFWFAGIALWLALTYAVFTIFTVKDVKPLLSEGINGGWLLAVVATQAVSNLGGLLALQFKPYQEEVLFYTLVMWLCGGMLYIWMISLIFYRYTFFKFAPSDLAPPYWINMGAVAITTLAGTRLIANAGHSTFLQGILPFLKGFTLFFWATATWWIPMLVTLALWRHLYKKYPVAYDPLYWGLVFPLGMYTASTYQLAQVTGLSFLFAIPQCFVFIALTAWIITFLGLLHRLISNLQPTPRQAKTTT